MGKRKISAHKAAGLAAGKAAAKIRKPAVKSPELVEKQFRAAERNIRYEAFLSMPLDDENEPH